MRCIASPAKACRIEKRKCHFSRTSTTPPAGQLSQERRRRCKILHEREQARVRFVKDGAPVDHAVADAVPARDDAVRTRAHAAALLISARAAPRCICSPPAAPPQVQPAPAQSQLAPVRTQPLRARLPSRRVRAQSQPLAADRSQPAASEPSPRPSPRPPLRSQPALTQTQSQPASSPSPPTAADLKKWDEEFAALLLVEEYQPWKKSKDMGKEQKWKAIADAYNAQVRPQQSLGHGGMRVRSMLNLVGPQ